MLRPRAAVVGLSIVFVLFAAGTGMAEASSVRPKQHFEGVVNGRTTDVVVHTACPGPATGGRTGPLAGRQSMAVVRARNGAGYTGPFRQIYGWFAQDASSSTPTQLTFTSYNVKQAIPSSIRVPCEGDGQVQFSSCPFGAPCAAGFVPDVVDVHFVNIAV